MTEAYEVAATFPFLPIGSTMRDARAFVRSRMAEETEVVVDNVAEALLRMSCHADLCACSECGCTDIQATAWYELNTGEMTGDDGPTDQIWCPQCDAETSIAYTRELKPYRRES